jgi:hypothetical protein
VTTDAAVMDPEAAQRILVMLGQDPAELRGKADELMAQWGAALAEAVQLPMEAEQLRAQATALEAVRAARGPVVAAEAAVAEAEQAYSDSAAPEEQAASTAARARHEAEQAADLLEQARAANAEPARKKELLKDAEAAAVVSEWEEQALVDAREARARAKAGLDDARALLARAHAGMEAKVRALDAPLTSPDREWPERLASLIPTWPGRIALRNTPGHAMDAQDMTIARALCEAAAADLRVCPEGIAIDIAAQTALMAVAKPRGAKVKIPYVGETTVMELVAVAEKAHRTAPR